MGYSAVGDPQAALADIHLHSDLAWHSNSIATLSAAYTTNFLSGTQLRSEWVWEENGNEPCLWHGGNAWRRGGSAARGMLPSTWGTSPATSPGGIRVALFHQDTFELWEL